MHLHLIKITSTLFFLISILLSLRLCCCLCQPPQGRGKGERNVVTKNLDLIVSLDRSHVVRPLQPPEAGSHSRYPLFQMSPRSAPQPKRVRFGHFDCWG